MTETPVEPATTDTEVVSTGPQEPLPFDLTPIKTELQRVKMAQIALSAQVARLEESLTRISDTVAQLEGTQSGPTDP